MNKSSSRASARRLRLMFQSVLASALGPAACSRISPSDFESNACATAQQYAAPYTLDRITPGIAVDYMEIRSELSDGTLTGPATLRRGTPCATATDAAACAASLGALRSPVGWSEGSVGGPPVHRYMVFTRGDAVTAITSFDALGAFLSPVENPADAAMLVAERGIQIRCEDNNLRAVAGGFELLGYTGSSCGSGTHIDRNIYSVTRAGAVRVIDSELFERGDPNCAVGRRPDGLCLRRGALRDTRSPAPPAVTEVGEYLSHMASLEAAAVFAFERLARELEAHRAPRHLVGRARRAARDERRHATAARALADRYGASRMRVAVARRDVRPLADIARENAVEGCVRETFGALQATLQARRAADPEVAKAMRQIALDETRHAALSWAVAAWIEPKLAPEARAGVEQARREAMAQLGIDLRTSQTDAVITATGAPSASEAVAMHRAMAGSGPWAQSAA